MLGEPIESRSDREPASSPDRASGRGERIGGKARRRGPAARSTRPAWRNLSFFSREVLTAFGRASYTNPVPKMDPTSESFPAVNSLHVTCFQQEGEVRMAFLPRELPANPFQDARIC